MKRMLFLIVSCVMVLTQCEHPYEQDLIGSFPFADMLDENPGDFSSDAGECVLRVSTNMVISTKTNYVEGGSVNWLTVDSEEEQGGIVRLIFKIDSNVRREIRQAEVTVYADGSTKVGVVTITQKAYVVSGKENVCEGDLVLKTQDEIDNCIYTKVKGNLIIGSHTGDIKDLSPLDVITAVEGDVRIFGCDVSDMGPLGNLAVRSVEFDAVNPELVRTWKGSVKEVTVRNIGSGNVSLSSFKLAEKLVLSDNLCTFSGFDDLTMVKVAEMKLNKFTDTEGMEGMVKLDSLYLSDNPLVNVNSLAKMTRLKKVDLSRTNLAVNQIYYLQQYLTEGTEIVCDEISGGSSLEFQIVEIKYFSARLEARYDSGLITISSGTNTYGCILSTEDKFSAEDLIPLKLSTNPLTFDLKNLTPGTRYYMWLYAVDKNGGIHISEKLVFTTPEIVYDYKGDLVLETQDDVDECVHVTVSGNLVIGKEGSDIQDISKLTITAVGGGVTIRGCHLLGDFGPVDSFDGIKYLELDDVSASMPYQWDGSLTDLRIRNISTGTVNLSRFNDLTHLTLQSNNCGFSGWSSLTKVTDAVLSGNQFTTTDDFAEMKMLKNIDLRNNPLVNVNSLVEMTSLQKIDLSETMLSQTQVNYLKSVLPSTAVVTADILKGTASLSVQEELAKYRSAVMSVEHSGFPASLYYCGYALSKTSVFPGIEGLQYIDESIPDSFSITDLEADTEYYVWFVVVDNVGSYHLSEPATFRTKKIVENYVGDLVLKTQDDVDECVHTSVTGNLTIGGTDSDINDLSSLGIKSVSGDLTITGCSSLSSFGGIKNLTVKKVILDKTNQTITKTWEGEADALIIRNTTGSSSCSLSAFDEITSLTLSDNNCSFTNLDKLVNLTEADLPRNKFNNTVAMGAWTKIKTLNLNGNPLYNINELAQLTTLTSLDLSDTPLSATQVRYVQASLPTNVVVKSTGITGNGSLKVSNTGVDYFSASFNATISDISAYGGGYFFTDGTSFPGETGRVETVDSYGEVLTTFTANALGDGTTYTLWYYVTDWNDSYHISAPITFSTLALKHYTASINPTWPLYTNSSSEKTEFTAICSRSLIDREGVLGETNAVFTKSGSSFSTDVTEGQTAMGLFAVQGTPSGNSYDGYTMEVTTKDMSSPKWTLGLTSENGSGSDIAVATMINDFQTDASFDVQFVRPVAKVSITADFTGSINNLDNVKDIVITLEDHYTKCQFADISSITNSTIKDLKFSASVDQMPDDKRVKVAEDRFVLPNASNYTPYASVTITFKNGSVKTKTYNLSTKIEANKVYDLTFVTAITYVDGSFTIDVVEVVHDEIEF